MHLTLAGVQLAIVLMAANGARSGAPIDCVGKDRRRLGVDVTDAKSRTARGIATAIPSPLDCYDR